MKRSTISERINHTWKDICDAFVDFLVEKACSYLNDADIISKAIIKINELL